MMALLDFGDLSETYALAELGVTLTYALLFEIDLEQRRRQQRQQQEQGGQQEQEQQAAAHSRNLHGHCVDASPELRAAMAAGQAVVVSPGFGVLLICEPAVPHSLAHMSAQHAA